MNPTEAKRVIKEYKPHKGFFDLSSKPSSLSEIEYAKVLNLQNFISEENEKQKYYKEHNKIQWEKLKELAAGLQSVIFEHWGTDIT